MIEFDSEEHKYTYQGEEFSSVTQFLEQFKIPFDKERWSLYVANRDGITQDEVLQMWSANAKKACAFGTAVHAYAEGVIKNVDGLGYTPKGKLGAVLKYVDSALKKLDCIKQSEVVVYNKELKLAGTIDLVRNVGGGVAILDWKTNKEIKLFNHYQSMLFPLAEYHDCNYNHYLFQLNLYKYLYEKQFNEKVVALGLIHLTPDGYSLIDVPIMDEDTERLVEVRRGEVRR